MPFDAYAIYCDHCRAMGQVPPTREWWNAAIRKPQKTVEFEPDFDIDTEKREGWAYE